MFLKKKKLESTHFDIGEKVNRIFLPKNNPNYIMINNELGLSKDDFVIEMAAKGGFMCKCVIEGIDDYKETYELKLLNFKIYQNPKEIKIGHSEIYFTKEDADVEIQKNNITYNWIFNQIHKNIRISKKNDLIKIKTSENITFTELDWANIVLAVEEKYGFNDLHKKITKYIDNVNQHQ